MRKRLRIDNFAGIVIIIILSMIILEFLFIFQVVQNSFEEQQKQELSRYVSFIGQSLDDALEVTKDYDALQNENLYEKARNVRNELSDVAAIDVTTEKLEELKEKYGFTGVAIFAPSDGDIMILNSTNPDEIGLSTADWRYWNTAFQSLLKREPVDVGRGQYFEDFWVGPKTKSRTLKGYYRFGYIYNPNGHYLINGYVESDEMVAARAAGSVDNTLDDIQLNIDYIDNIGIVKSDILKDYRNTDYEGSNKDPLVLHGNIENTGFTKIEYDVDELMSSGRMLFEDLGRNSQKLVLKKLNDTEILVIIINNIKMEQLLNSILKVTIGLTTLAGLSILAVNFWMIRKYGALLDVQRERLSLAKSFQKTIQSMPSMIFHCRLNQAGEIVLTYNDGRAFSQEEVVLTESEHVRLDALYSEEFSDIAMSHIMKAFSKNRSRFEATNNGHVFDVIVSPVIESGVDEKTGLVREIIGIGTDISDRFTREKNVEYMALHDQLTGLPNRRSFIQDVEEEMEDNSSLFVMYFDLDRFKTINDTYNHQVGDEVLQAVADRLRLYTNDALHVARMGGDEFIACCQGLPLEDVEVLTQRIIDTISKPIELDNAVCSVGASAGISQYPVDGKTAEELISKADKAMYESKAQGGSTYKVS